MNGTNYEVPHCEAFSTLHTFLSWGPIIGLGDLFSNTLRSSLNVRDNASHPYSRIGNIIVFFFIDTYSPTRAFASVIHLLQTSSQRPQISFPNKQYFTGWGCQPHAQPQIWRTRSHIYNTRSWVPHQYPQVLGTHFSHLLRIAWATMGLLFNPCHQIVYIIVLYILIFKLLERSREDQSVCIE